MRVASRPVVFVVVLIVFSLMTMRFFDHTVDDAFIGFRYAENLVAGNGLVFNPGERVEGYTNFLWVMLIAPFLALGADPEPVARILGLLAATGTLAAIVRFSPKPEVAPEVVWIAPLLLASSPAFVVWASGGMETPLFGCLVLWAVGLAMGDLERQAIRPASALCIAGAALVRPEGFGVAVVLGALLLVLGRAQVGRSRGLLRWSLAFLVVFLPYFIWRWSYYGYPLPNTFYAKVGSDPSQAIRGLRYAHGFFLESGYWLLLPCLGLIGCGRKVAIAVLGGVATAFAGYVVLVGGDGLPMYRFLAPILPLLYLLIAMGVAGTLQRWGSRRNWRIVAAVLVLALCARAALPAFRGPSARYVVQDRLEVSGWKQIGLWFAANAPADASIAVIPAGAMPYFSKLRTIDMLGLNDRTIAHRQMTDLGGGQAGHEKYDVEYVLSRRPTYVLVGVYGLSPRPLAPEQLVRPYYAAEIELLKSVEFSRTYDLHRGQTAAGYFAYFSRAAVPRE